jgi:hypothetical protein
VFGWRRSALIEAVDGEAQCVPEAQL